MGVGKPLAILVAIVCCGACEYAPTMQDRTVASNPAVANVTNQVLLLNVVRAGHRLPTYPKPCMTAVLGPASRSGVCSAEYPDNESLQVLNFVNQMWGLQKESVQGSTSPLIVVNLQ